MPQIWPITVASAAPTDPHLRERADAEDHQRVEDDVDDRTGQALQHRDDHVAGRLLHLFTHHRDHDEHAQADRDVRILHRLRRNVFASAPNAFTNTPDRPKPSTRNTIPPTTDSAMPCSAAESACSWRFSPRRRADQRVDAHARTHADRNDQRLQREHQRHRGQRALRILRHEDTVHNVVQRIDQHGQHRGQRHGENQRSHARGAHFVFFHDPFPLAKSKPHRNQSGAAA